MKKEPESKQMYLKTILTLEKTNGKVRNIDIATELGYSKPSVTVAIRKLVSDGMVRIDQDKSIVLTEKGKKIAEKMLVRYEVLSDYFESLGVGKIVAEENACRMEHFVTDELFEKIRMLSASKEGEMKL